MGKPLALDLFCGAGGAGAGLEEAGYRVVGMDNWQPAIDTHRANSRIVMRADLKERDLSSWQGKVDLVWGSPPCQPYSYNGKWLGRADDRDCIPDFIRCLKEIQPPVFVMENVWSLTFTRFRPYFVMTLARLRVLGYHVWWKVLDAADYGVPQRRRRVFVVGVRPGEIEFDWPEPTHADSQAAMGPALGWTHDGWWQERPSTVVMGDARIFRPGEHGKNGKPPQHVDAVKVTAREQAILQDFPEGYKFVGTKTQVRQLIGNAVPRTMAREIASSFVRVEAEGAA